MLSLSLTWMEKHDIVWNDPIAPFLNPLKTKKNLHFTTLNYTLDYTLQSKFYISIQVNGKLNIGNAKYNKNHSLWCKTCI